MSETLAESQIHKFLIDSYEMANGNITCESMILGGNTRLAVFVDHTNVSANQMDIFVEISDNGQDWYYWLDDSNSNSTYRTKVLTSSEKWTWNFDSILGNYVRVKFSFSNASAGDLVSVSGIIAR